ncbi:MAG: ATP-binding protein [Candidatus Saccharimonadales bacterium]
MGGKSSAGRDKYSLLIAATIRRVAAFLALFVTFYAIAADFGWVVVSPLYSATNSLILSSLTIAIAIWIYYHRRSTSNHSMQLALVPFHILGIAMPIFITGYMSPLTVLWSILIALSYILVSRIMMIYSTLMLIAVMMMSLASASYLSWQMIISHMVFTMIIIVMGWFISSLQTINSAEHNDFVKEKAERSSQQNQLMTLINSVNEAIISINAHGTVQLYNAATLNLLDTNESLSGKKLDEVLSTYSETGEPIKLFNELKNSAPSITRQDLELRFADGETMSLDISSSRIRGIDNETQGYILVIRDITRSKSFDEERDEFISVVSHELRTPVTITEGTISNSIMLIEKGAAPSVVAQALSSAHEQTMYLARMINDLSTLSRAERGVGAEKESIDVTDLMHQLYNEYHKKASEKKLHLNLDISPTLGTVEASRLYLEEVLQNFLTNAIKYTQKGTITLTARRQKGTIVFAVTDTGIGISKHEQKKVFEKFYRAEDYRTRETNGTGLGLYVVKKLADKMGISIDLSSRLNHGSTFSFSLPSVVVDKSSSKK